jgi:hypothetical protein
MSLYKSKYRTGSELALSFCPICWDHALEKLEGIRLSARTFAEQPFISRVLVYRCSSWHVFAVFEQAL